MERNFPVIITELRKEKGLSQKEAAAKLGISQALLSHYEKGIRECGQSFLIKIADFYGVSCDYILGRSRERNDFMAVAEHLISGDNDYKPTSRTFIKAATQMVSMLNEGDKRTGVQLDIYLAIALYKLLLINAYAGNLPKNWAGRAYVDGNVCCNSTYLGITDLASYQSVLPPAISKNPEPDAPVPEAVKTLVKIAEDYILSVAIHDTPPVPAEYIK